jgi:8-oxo-dGTP pyrophosphatase MutT (NUDIX family)
MTEARVASVDVYILRRGAAGWETLLLQRAEGTRCTGAWEAVHGHIDEGERPQDAAVRELREETALEVERLYNLNVSPFYLHKPDVVMLAVAFVAFPRGDEVILGPEHARYEWLPVEEASKMMAWPRSRSALADALALLGNGDAGPVEDVLRVI